MEHKGSVEIIPPHIEVHTKGLVFFKGTSKERKIPTEQTLKCTGCDAETTYKFRRSVDPRKQQEMDQAAAEQIVGFLNDHPSKDHRMWRGRPRKPMV